MRKMFPFKRITFLSFAVFLACFDLQAQGVSLGDSVALGNGVVRTWVEIDAEKKPIKIGTTFTKGVLSNLPSVLRQISLALPQVTSDSLFNHVLFDWNPNGHHPMNIFGLPHFDFHFVMVSRQEREAVIPGVDGISPAAEFIPQDYVPTPGLGSVVVPIMGVHWSDTTSHEFHREIFSETLIYGFYRGKMFFVEPMITKAFFETNPNLTKTIKQPMSYQISGYYPTSYSISYDSDKEEYNVVIHDFVLRSALTSVGEKDLLLPSPFRLSQNYPNPFNPSTTIKFEVANSSFVTIQILDILGRKVRGLVSEFKPAGAYEVKWNGLNDAGRAVPSGLYFYRIENQDQSITKKMVLLQ